MSIAPVEADPTVGESTPDAVVKPELPWVPMTIRSAGSSSASSTRLEATPPSRTSSRVLSPATRHGSVKRSSSASVALRACASKWGGSANGSPAVGGISVGITQALTISASYLRPSTTACSSAPFANSEKSVGQRILRTLSMGSPYLERTVCGAVRGTVGIAVCSNVTKR